MIHMFRGVVNEDGKLSLYQPDSFRESLASLRNKVVELRIQKHVRKRTINQNSYYHGVVLQMLSEHTGYTPQELHDACKWKFLMVNQDSDLPTVRSTTSLTTKEFADYVDSVIQLAAEMGCVIPEAISA